MCGPIIELVGGLYSQFEDGHAGLDSQFEDRRVGLDSQFGDIHVWFNHHVNGWLRLTVFRTDMYG